ncbi:oxygenase MpaB family protein, partial [Rhodococcus phenolicus]|uniref:oxygenase MpaB family protein n=1 Tax=Rhodococcus phenolicus TaxID=263849 RepID=UPI000A4E2E89
MGTRTEERVENSAPEEAQLPPIPPGSVNLEDFVGESMLLLGAGATVLLQLAEPGVGLRTTMTYVYAVTLGTEDEKKAIVRLVNKAHVPVRAESYNAFDPELQLWVAATLYRNGLGMYERFFGKLSEADAER